MKKDLGGSNARTYDRTTCSCGRHFGVGIWDAELKARKYAWYRDVYKQGYDSIRREYLTDYEKYHGHQSPNI